MVVCLRRKQGLGLKSLFRACMGFRIFGLQVIEFEASPLNWT